MATVHRAEEIAGQKVGYLLDTKGPEIRTELFEGDAKEYSYKTGEKSVLQLNKVSNQLVKLSQWMLLVHLISMTMLKLKNKFLLTVNLVFALLQKDPATREFEVEVENDGIIAKQKVIFQIQNSFPSTCWTTTTIFCFGLEQGINFIAISFVRTAKDVNEVRAICEETGNGA